MSRSSHTSSWALKTVLTRRKIVPRSKWGVPCSKGLNLLFSWKWSSTGSTEAALLLGEIWAQAWTLQKVYSQFVNKPELACSVHIQLQMWHNSVIHPGDDKNHLILVWTMFPSKRKRKCSEEQMIPCWEDKNMSMKHLHSQFLFTHSISSLFFGWEIGFPRNKTPESSPAEKGR